jgi:hypothetical protein
MDLAEIAVSQVDEMFEKLRQTKAIIRWMYGGNEIAFSERSYPR